MGLSLNIINITRFSNTTKSLLTSLKDAGRIPSLSWSYTAGVSYMQPPAFGSLILGGYDKSRFIPHNVSFPLGPVINRELLVFVNSIKISTAKSAMSLGIYAAIDSLVPDLWLPTPVCDQLQSVLGLQYNRSVNRYFLNESRRDQISGQDINISIFLGQNAVVNITLPWRSFDLTDKTSAVGKGDQGPSYFPVWQVKNST